MAKRGFFEDAIEQFKLGFDGSRLVIPYLSPVGAWYIKRRCIADHEDCKPFNHPKYLCEPGIDLHLFNAQVLRTATTVVAVEGELKTIAGQLCGVPHVGIPGVSTWKKNKSSWIHCFDSVDRFVFVADGDEPRAGKTVGVGEELANAVVADIRRAYPDITAQTVVLPVGLDIDKFVKAFGRAAYLEKIGL